MCQKCVQMCYDKKTWKKLRKFSKNTRQGFKIDFGGSQKWNWQIVWFQFSQLELSKGLFLEKNPTEISCSKEPVLVHVHMCYVKAQYNPSLWDRSVAVMIKVSETSVVLFETNQWAWGPDGASKKGLPQSLKRARLQVTPRNKVQKITTKTLTKPNLRSSHSNLSRTECPVTPGTTSKLS